MSDPKPPRRPEFDEIANGWSGDTAPDLSARIDLACEWQSKNGPLSFAETRVMNAMVDHHHRLTSPTCTCHVCTRSSRR